MSRVLFFVVPERGHLNPCIAPAQALQAAGHAVAFHAVGDIRAQLQRAGGFECLGPVASSRPVTAWTSSAANCEGTTSRVACWTPGRTCMR